MPDRARTLAALIRCLRAAPPHAVDWMAVIALANRSLTIAELAVALKDVGKAIPDDVSSYLAFIRERNEERNRRLSAQLAEAVTALRARKLEPLLLKGAVTLALSARERVSGRMLSDLDLMLAPADVPRALACLEALGYELAEPAKHPSALLAARLSRPQDAGVIDLHQRLLPQSSLVRPDLDRDCASVDSRFGTVLVPSPALQLLILVLHDQLHDGDYWTGRIELRHLLDMAALTSAREGIDWERLAALLPSRLARNALETQLVTMYELVGGRVPRNMRARLWPRMQHRRRMLQIRFPQLGVPLCMATIAWEARNYPAHTAVGKREDAAGPVTRGARPMPLRRRALRLRNLVMAEATSKI